MAKNFVLITLAVTCIFIQTTHAASFECADDPAVCKTKFATQFENGFMDIQFNAVHKFKVAYTEIGNIIKSAVPENSPQAKYMLDHINKMHNALDIIQGNVGDIKKFVEALKATTQGGDDVPHTADFDEMLEKHGFPNILFDILRKMAADTGNLWAEMYKGLSEKDLTTYPEYAEINRHMEMLRADDGRLAEASDFMQAAEILGTKFNLPYFAEMKDIEKI